MTRKNLLLHVAVISNKRKIQVEEMSAFTLMYLWYWCMICPHYWNYLANQYKTASTLNGMQITCLSNPWLGVHCPSCYLEADRPRRLDHTFLVAGCVFVLVTSVWFNMTRCWSPFHPDRINGLKRNFWAIFAPLVSVVVRFWLSCLSLSDWNSRRILWNEYSLDLSAVCMCICCLVTECHLFL